MVEWPGSAVLIAMPGGCGSAQPNDGTTSIMLFGLFKKKYTTTVHPEVGGALRREAAFPEVEIPPAPSHPVIRNISVDAPPPSGKLAKVREEQPPAEAFILDAVGDLPAVALVNNYVDDFSASFWEVDGDHFGRPRSVSFDENQAKWSMWSARGVVPLPAGRMLFHLKYDDPIPRSAVFVYNTATDGVRKLGKASPGWWRGLPLEYVSSLQVRPDAVLVAYASDEERIGAMRYVNHFDHLVLFSPKHPDGLEIVTLGLDDGSARDWGMVGDRLWLGTADDRASPALSFVWSLDLGAVL